MTLFRSLFLKTVKTIASPAAFVHVTLSALGHKA